MQFRFAGKHVRFEQFGIPQFAPGDGVESFLQSALLGSGWFPAEWIPGSADVQGILNFIANTVQAESNCSPKNYFIVVAHSQGNFHAEILLRLLADQGLLNRVGIVSLASPTNYRSVDGFAPNFINRDDAYGLGGQLLHFTRADDMILLLRSGILQVLASQLGITLTLPFEDNLPALWKSSAPVTLKPPSGPPPNWHGFVQSFQGCTQFLPQEQDPLLVPQVNAHLIDNYLDDATRKDPNDPQTLEPSVWPITRQRVQVLKQRLQLNP